MAETPFKKTAENVYGYILGYYTDNEYMPTLQEIAGRFTNRRTGDHYTRAWAKLCVDELVRQGKVKVEPRKRRGIVLIEHK
jgi:hypothetical protein